jgi:O-antigen ligase
MLKPSNIISFTLKSFKKFDLSLIVVALSAVICLFPKLVPIFISVFALVTISDFFKKKSTFSFSFPLFLLILFYLCYLFGTLFTEDQLLANRYIENKVAFVVFPFLFMFTKNEPIRIFNSASLGLFIGVVLLGILGGVNGFLLWSNGGYFEHSFFMSGFSYIHHPSYYSAFLWFAMFVAIYGYIEKKTGCNFIRVLVFIGFCCLAQILCSSFAGIIILAIGLLTVLCAFLFKRVKRSVFFIFVGVSFFFVSIVLGRNLASREGEIYDTYVNIIDYVHDPLIFNENHLEYKTGNQERLILWTATLLEITEHPWGVGTGNVDHHLRERLIEMNQYELSAKNYNPHNQFLQTTLEVGLGGLFVLVLFFGYALVIGFKNRNWLLVLIVLNLVFNSLFESMLQRQSGIVFYSFWICLLIASVSFKVKKKKNIQELSGVSFHQ